MRPRIGITANRAADEERMKRYLAYVAEAGGDPVLLRPGDRVDLDELDGLLLSGGADVHSRHYRQPLHPLAQVDEERDDFELPLGREAVAGHVPIFGICRGFQVLNVLYGGQLIQHLEGHRAGEAASAPSGQHEVRVAEGSRLAELLPVGSVLVNSRHHQGLRESELAPSLKATAWSPDGLVEAVEPTDRTDRFVLGVQWHPERVNECDPSCRELARAFVAAAAKHAERRLIRS